MPTKIEWTQDTWNPVTGCTPISDGCAHCYARAMARRLAGRYGYPEGNGFAVTCHDDRLAEPLRWRKPRRVFVCSMGDLFHEDVPDAFIDRVFAVMAMRPQHTFQVLTKRAERMEEWLSACEFEMPQALRAALAFRSCVSGEHKWPLPNVWGGVTVEHPDYLDRVEWLMRAPFAVRFISAEPLLGPLDVSQWLAEDPSRVCRRKCHPTVPCRGPCKEYLEASSRNLRPHLDWVIVGGESGPGARPMHPDWARGVRDQCVSAGVPFFFKQWGAWGPEFEDWSAEVDAQTPMVRVGKKAAGRVLDGRTWDQYPEVPK